MQLHVFNVEHGACALLTDNFGRRIMIDCGHNASQKWYPGTTLRTAGITRIEALFVTNYDEDHVSGIIDLFGNVQVPRIWRNSSVSPALIRSLKTEDGMGRGIDFLVQTLERWQTSGGTTSFNDLNLSGVQIEAFWNSPYEFDDENNLSMALRLTCDGVTFMFTGDLEEAGWKALLKSPDFQRALQTVDVFFASHHGRESGCCNEVFQYCSPTFVVISDKAKGFQTQETTDWYRHRAKGGKVAWQPTIRSVLTTRSDGHFVFNVTPNAFTVHKF